MFSSFHHLIGDGFTGPPSCCSQLCSLFTAELFLVVTQNQWMRRWIWEGGAGGLHWYGLVKKSGGKLRCWIGCEALMDQWDTWILILLSFSLKFASSPDSLCLLLFQAHCHTDKIHTHAHKKHILTEKVYSGRERGKLWKRKTFQSVVT